MTTIEKNLVTKVTTSVIIPFPTKGNNNFIMVLNAKDSKWGLPGGKVDPFEPLHKAGSREALEETDAHVIIRYPVGLYYFKSEHGNPILTFTYAAEHLQGMPRPIKEESILDVRAFSIGEIRKLERENQLRPGRVAADMVEDYLAGKRLPEDFIRTYF